MNFFVTKIVEDSDVTYNLTVAGYVALAAVMLVVFAAGCMFRDKNKKMDAKQIAFCAMAMALAVVTSMFKIIDMPMGGSLTLFSMLFIVLTGYWFGVRTGITTAVAYNGAYIGLEAAITLIVLALPPVNEAMQAVKKLVCEA